MSDPEGRFTLCGVGRDLRATLRVHHSRFALQSIPVETNSASKSKPITAVLVPAQIITGGEPMPTGEGVPHGRLEVRASQGRVAVPPITRPTTRAGST